MLKFVLIVGILLIIVVIGFALYDSPVPVTAEYSAKISVDGPDKIENAISNVMSDLKKRDFVPVYLEVNWNPLSKIYAVYAKGIDRTKLRSLIGNVQEN